MSAMVVATTTTTTADVVGIRETAVGRPATRGNSYTAANVNAWTRLSRREAVLVNVEVSASRLTAVVTTTTTTAAAPGTAVTAAAHPATSVNFHTVKSASAWIHQRRKLVARRSVSVVLKHTKETNDATTRTTIAHAIGTAAIVAAHLATRDSSIIVRPANAWTRQRKRRLS